MSNFIKFPSIEQFRNIVREVRQTAAHHGIEEPELTFMGSVKLHGTNAGIGYDPETDTIWAQSRNNVITPEKDNAGFAQFVYDNEDALKNVLSHYAMGETLIVFGEWCGGNIQKGVGITGLDKMFVIFGQSDYKGMNITGSVTDALKGKIENIYSIVDFGLYTVGVDFSKPELSVSELQKITEQVEEECPVAKHFGVDKGTGEGVVWHVKWMDKRFAFKVKGEKHSVSKVKKLADVDVEKIKSIDAFVEYAATENRFQQGMEVVFTQNSVEPHQSKTGDFVRWVVGDIAKEESDTLTENGLTAKDVNSRIGKKAAAWFLSNI